MTTPEQDASLAHAALAAGDLQHALQHALGALTADLQNPAWTALLDRVLDATDDPLAFTAFGDNPWHGQVAAHARALHRLGHHTAALSLLIQIAQHLPDQGWLRWGEIRAVEQAEHLWYPLLAYREAHQHTPERMAPVVELLDRLPRAPRLRWIRSLALRSLGRYEEALAASEAAFSADPVREFLISSACSLRALQRPDEAVAAYRRAQHMKPDDLSPTLDIADTLFDAERFREALSAYRYYEAEHPDHPWATPSALFCQWQVSGETEDFYTLTRWLNANPASRRAQQLLKLTQASDPQVQIEGAQIGEQAEDAAGRWLRHLPSPADASINAIRNLAAREQQIPQGAQLQLSASGLESPSVLLAWEELCRRRGWEASLELRCDVQSDPDPREPIPEVGIALWTWEGHRPVAQFSPEFPELGAAVAEVAARPFDADGWAAALRGRGWDDAQTGDLACWMLEPPPGPAGITPWDWVLRFQTACALGMAAAGGWQGSVRRAALTKILLGVMDWPVAAAAVALAWIARQEPERSEEIQHWFALRMQHRPARGYCCYEDAVLRSWLTMPGVPADIEGQIRSRL